MKLDTITITLFSVASIFGVLAYNGSQMSPVSTREVQSELIENDKAQFPIVQLQQVEVINVEPASYRAEVMGYGEVKSRYELTFTTEVSGRIETVSPEFESGQVVKKGTILTTMNATSYQQALTQAQVYVAQAELNLLEEQRQGEQAKYEWLHSGLKGNPDSPLVLRTPQLTQVKAALKNAKQEFKKAQQDLDKTRIKAPFDALVVTRDVQPGSYVQVGTQVATLYSIDVVEIKVPLSEKQWNILPYLDNEQLKQSPWPVTVQSSDGQYQWQGNVERIEQHLTQDTRQRSLIVVVEKPLEQQNDLYPGTFVQARIKGREIDSLWQLPASSISQQGDIWLVNKGGLLQNSPAKPQFEMGDFVYVMPTDTADTQESTEPTRVVKRPLRNFQSGVRVIAKNGG